MLVCAADMPLITAAVLRSLASADAGGAPAVIATSEGGLQPQLGRYEPAALALLAPSAAEGRRSLREVVSAIGPALVEVPEPVLFNVNTRGGDGWRPWNALLRSGAKAFQRS